MAPVTARPMKMTGVTPFGTFTPWLDLSKPTVNGPETSNNWGYDLNLNFDKLDAWVGPLPGRITVLEDIINAGGGGGGAGVTDGDKGDIVVGNNGLSWVFDGSVVTAAGRAILDDTSAAAQRATLGAIEEAPDNEQIYGRGQETWIPMGSLGGLSTGEYSFIATITPPPSTGQMRFNHATQSLATQIFLHDINAVGVDISNGLRLITPGNRILVQDKADSSKYQYYFATGNAIDNTSFWTIPVSWVAGNTAVTAGRVMVAVFGLGVVINEAPTDGKLYSRRGSNASWVAPTVSLEDPTGGVDGDIWYTIDV